jgi:hypothetical protein
MFGLEWSLIIGYLVFGSALFYLQLYIKHNPEITGAFHNTVLVSSFLLLIFQIIFLFYIGYKISWLGMFALVALSFLVMGIVSFLELKFMRSDSKVEVITSFSLLIGLVSFGFLLYKIFL